MAYEWAMPLHITGTTMTVISNFLLPAGIPLDIEMFVSLSNPGMIDAAAKHWKDAAEKASKLKDDLEKAKKLDPEFWTGDDRTAFEHQIQAYETQLNALTTGLNGVGDVLEIVAVVFMVLCCVVLTVGLILLALFLTCLAILPIPIIGEAYVTACNEMVAGVVAAITPSFTTLKTALPTFVAFMGLIWATWGGAIDFKHFTKSGSAPDFTQVQTPALTQAPS